MSLSTLGAVLKFALELETTARDFYEKNVSIYSFKNLLLQYDKRIKKIKKIRRENTTEMILEPIIDFYSESFEFTFLKVEKTDENKIEYIGRMIEETLKKYYEEAAKKISFLNEVSYKFDELALEHKNNSISMKLGKK